MSDQPIDPTDPQPPLEPSSVPEAPGASPTGPPSMPGQPPMTTGTEPMAMGVEPMATPYVVNKPSASRYAIIGAVVLALGAGAVFVAKSKNNDAALSAGSPTAAVENMLTVIGQGRIVDLLRGEFPWMASVGELDEAALAAGGLPGGRISGMSLAGDGLTFDVAEVGDELAIVSITGGALRYSVDLSKMPAAITAAMPPGMPQIEISDSVPITVLEQGMCESFDEPDRVCPGLEIVTVNDAGGWRVSLMHTMMHLSGAGTLEPRNPNGAISAADIEDRIEDALFQNDMNAFFDLLDPQEFAWVSDFRIDADSSDPAPSVDLQFEVVDETAERAFLKLTGFESRSTEIVIGELNPETFEYEVGEQEVVTSFDGDCIVHGDDEPKCLSDLASIDLGPFASAQPILDKLAQDGIRLGLVKRDELWYISVAETFAPFAPTIKAFTDEFGAIAAQCKDAFSGFDPNGFDGTSDPFADVPPACQALMLGPLGMLGGMRAETGMQESITVPGY